MHDLGLQEIARIFSEVSSSYSLWRNTLRMYAFCISVPSNQSVCRVTQTTLWNNPPIIIYHSILSTVQNHSSFWCILHGVSLFPSHCCPLFGILSIVKLSVYCKTFVVILISSPTPARTYPQPRTAPIQATSNSAPRTSDLGLDRGVSPIN